MNMGLMVLLVMLVILAALALRQQQDFGAVARRFIEQFAMLVPRMLCALVAAGFIAKLIPQQAIASLLGADAGLMALPIAVLAGMIIPAGPVITFAIAAVNTKGARSRLTPAFFFQLPRKCPKSMWNSIPDRVIMMLSLCRSAMPSTYVNTQ